MSRIPAIVWAFILLLLLLALWQWDRSATQADWLPEQIGTVIGVIVTLLLKNDRGKE